MVKRSLVLLFVALSILLVLVNLDFVYSGHISTPRTLSVNTSYNYLFNISINTTDTAGTGEENVTQINITLPTGFVFIARTNGSTKAVTANFTNISSVSLSWSNFTYFLLNGSQNNASFWFNATTPSTPGVYNISIMVMNTTGVTHLNQTNLTVRVQSTVAPLVYLISPVNGNESVNPVSYLNFTFNVSDDSSLNLTNCTLYFRGVISMINDTISLDGSKNTTVRFSNYSWYNTTSYAVDNIWYVNCTDSDNNMGNSTRYAFALRHVEFNGTVKDQDGNALSRAMVNISVIKMAGWTTTTRYSTVTNASGAFNLTVWSEVGFVQQPSIRYTNITHPGNYTVFISKSLPPFPAGAGSSELERIAGTTFYLAPAGTMNITAIHMNGTRAWFTYQIKDSALSYPIAEEHSTKAVQVVAYVPKSRNYTIMVYAEQAMPVSYSWTGFNETANYSIPNNPLANWSNYSAGDRVLNYKFNLSMTMVRVRGYFNFTTNPNWSEFTIIPYLIEGNNLVHAQYGVMPYNLSFMMGTPGEQTDNFSLVQGWYNMSLPATFETSKILLFATARNGTVYYGGFKNLSFAYGAASYHYNFTAYGMIGPAITNISLNRVDGDGGFINISAARKTFTIVNETGTSNLANLTAHVETDVAYTIDGKSLQFTWLSEIAQKDSAVTSTFILPLLNITGVKETRVFANGGPAGENSQYAPRTVLTKTAAEIISSGNITLKTFSPNVIGTQLGAGNITITLYMSNTTCDIPIPASSCIVGSSATMATFNPMRSIMGGGKISFRMSYGNITVHYVNVDLLASGPPEALFDSSTNVTTGGSTLSYSAVRFGSSGPKIYDYALIALPYLETAGSGFDDTLPVNMTIPQLYDENWNVVWNRVLNGSVSNLVGNFSHYSSYSSDWEVLMNQTTCYNSTRAMTNSLNINSSMPCWVNQTDNRVWVRIPHFSGTEPTVSGSLLPATAAATTTTSSGGGGGAAGITYAIAAYEYQAGTTKKVNAGDILKYSVGTTSHTITITSFTSASVTLNIASNTSKIVSIKAGETQKIEQTGDDYYDTSITYNGIVSGKASITVKAIHEQVTAEVPETPAEETIGDKIQEVGEKVGEAVKSNKGIVIAIILLVVIIAAVVILKSRNKKRY